MTTSTQTIVGPQAATVSIGPEALHGHAPALPEGTLLALLLEGELVATAPLGPGATIHLPLPPPAIAGQLDIVDAATGDSLLPTPLDLADARRLEWLGWSIDKGRIAGRFRTTPPRPAILVQAFAGDRLLFQAVATPQDGVHHFSAWLRTLPVPGETFTLRPCLNRLELDHPFLVDAAAVGIAGCLDLSNQPKINGWATHLADPTQPVPIEIRLNHQPIATIQPTDFRQDLRDIGLGEGLCGFSIPFPPETPTSRDVTVQAFIAGTGIQLAGSPYRLVGTPPDIQGILDLVTGKHAEGWAVDIRDPANPLRMEAVCDGQVVGTGLADRARADLLQAGLPSGTCGFRIRLDPPLETLLGRDIAVRATGQSTPIPGSPKPLQPGPFTRFVTRAATIPAPLRQRLARTLTHRTAALHLTLILPVGAPLQTHLEGAIDAVLNQWSRNWELLCVDDGTGGPAITTLLEAAARQDARIRLLPRPGANRSTLLNAALVEASGACVLVLDPANQLEPDAVYRLARAALETGADILYGDEAVTTDDIDDVTAIYAWPAFSRDYVFGRPRCLDFAAFRTTTARAAGGWNDTLDLDADFDFSLRALDHAASIAHLPAILQRRRERPVDIATRAQAELGALQRHLAQTSQGVTASPGLVPGEFRVDWPDDGAEILVVIPTRDRLDLLKACLHSLETTATDANLRVLIVDHESAEPATLDYLASLQPPYTVLRYQGPFNFAQMNNLAVRQHAGDARYILFLNNDVTAIHPGWVQRLRSLVGRPDTGAAAPLLLYPGNQVQHAGVVIGFHGGADHAMRSHPATIDGQRDPGYLGTLTALRDWSALTAACMLVKRSLFDQLGGFDETFAVAFNDTDLCLRIAQSGQRVVYDGHTTLYHHESATRGAAAGNHPHDDDRLRSKWNAYFRDGDPFYNPLLALAGPSHTPDPAADCRRTFPPRIVTLPGPLTPYGSDRST